MIQSKFISDILDLLFDRDSLAQNFRPQINFLTEKAYEYTHSGLFVRFSQEKGIESFRATNDRLILDGVILRSKEIETSAEAILHFNKGLADYLEIWSHTGYYPKNEITKYTLTQEWIGSSGRKIVVD